jgi:hypothetical protein
MNRTASHTNYLFHRLFHQLKAKPNVGQVKQRLDIHKVGGFADGKQHVKFHCVDVFAVPFLWDAFNKTVSNNSSCVDVFAVPFLWDAFNKTVSNNSSSDTVSYFVLKPTQENRVGSDRNESHQHVLLTSRRRNRWVTSGFPGSTSRTRPLFLALKT